MIAIDLSFVELLILIVGFLIGNAVGEIIVLMFREWNYRRIRRQ